MPQPKMPGRVPREVDLFSSYPCPKQQQQTITNKEHGTTDTGFGRLGTTGGPGKREEEAESREKMGRNCRAVSWRRRRF